MFTPRTDLALAKDASGRFLPWVIAVMVFLALLGLAGAMAAQSVVRGWAGGLEGRLTVQIAASDQAPLAPRVAAALEALRATPGVRRAEPLDQAQVAALLSPWLGAGPLPADLPLPALIDVAAAPSLDVAALRARLEQAVAGATVDEPRALLDRLIGIARLVEGVSLFVVAAIGLATVAMVIFATRAGLAAHREAIEVLHLIGARDGYIAAQFQRQTLALALTGAAPGALLAGGVFVLVGWLAAGLDAALLPRIEFGAGAWLALAALPLLAVALATFTARLTVLGHLRDML